MGSILSRCAQHPVLHTQTHRGACGVAGRLRVCVSMCVRAAVTNGEREGARRERVHAIYN